MNNNEVLQGIEIIRKAIKQDLLFFATKYIFIEDPDKEGALLKFNPWPSQKKALNVFIEKRLVIALKARQLGLTWLALIYSLWNMITRPGCKVTGLSKGENEAKELVRRMTFMLRYLPRYIIRHVDDRENWDGPIWEAGVLGVAIHHPGKEDATFNAFAASPESGRSFTSSIVLIDEWAFQVYARQIWTAAYPTINRPAGGQVLGISTGKRGTLFEEIWYKAVAGENSFFPLFLPWNADPRRTQEWYEQTKKDLPNSYKQEYPQVPEDAFSAGEGAAFQEWDEQIHVPYDATWYPPPNWKIVRVYDGGYRRACCKWYAISPEGMCVCYREYYPKDTTDEEQAKEIYRLSKCPDGSSEIISQSIGDPACWHKQASIGKSTAEIFAKAGVNMTPGDNRNREQGWKRLHEFLRPFPANEGGELTARLVFTKACPNTIRTYPSLLQSETNPEDINTRQEDHCADVDRYFVMSRPTAPISEDQRKKREEKRRRLITPGISKITGY